jgi:hypothetical protein
LWAAVATPPLKLDRTCGREHLEPNDFESVGEVAHTLNAFEHHWSSAAQPFDWHFTRQDLEKLMQRLHAHEPQLQVAA